MGLIPALPEGIRVAIEIPIDWSVLASHLVFHSLLACYFGLIPALRVSRPDLIASLKEGSEVFAADTATRVYANADIAQVAFATLLLVGAGLALRSLQNISPTR